MDLESNATAVDFYEESMMNQSESSMMNLSTTLKRDKCYTTSDHWCFEAQFDFVVYGVILMAIGVIGLFGNVIAIFILTRPQMKVNSAKYWRCKRIPVKNDLKLCGHLSN